MTGISHSFLSSNLEIWLDFIHPESLLVCRLGTQTVTLNAFICFPHPGSVYNAFRVELSKENLMVVGLVVLQFQCRLCNTVLPE